MMSKTAVIRRFSCFAVALALPALSTTAHADLANGESIVRNICASCHGFPPQGGPNLAPNNPSLIQFALNNVAAMSFLRATLTQNDINDIAAYLASAPPAVNAYWLGTEPALPLP